MNYPIVGPRSVSDKQRLVMLLCVACLLGAFLVSPLTEAAWGDILPPLRESAEVVAKREAAAVNVWLPRDYAIFGGLVLAAFEGLCVVGLVKTRKRFLKKAATGDSVPAPENP